jgi:hypothetical protein
VPYKKERPTLFVVPTVFNVFRNPSKSSKLLFVFYLTKLSVNKTEGDVLAEEGRGDMRLEKIAK